ncbi:SHOCT domain-containing protein [Bremerella cremea]|uniref:SHOCT domain-containing protein n=1 Tax=Bremerella cremea TaxID=1031537 RepID=A0A368KML2_9BACT|nr:SHOCT domain-containing protein [Bremerella cremea]RCS40575.1 SHOCT domain-containing protein [Bremerella cremea]
MQQLSPEGHRIASDLAQRHGFSTDAVTHMLFAVLNGNGSMAQFCHPEFAGSGQWMQGGMMMLGDMFNYNLKGRVDALCNEISNLLASQPGLLQAGSFQSQSQSGGGQQQQGGGNYHQQQSGGGGYQSQANGGLQGQSSLFVPDPRAHWWPAELGQPNSTGSQNNLRYAYFAGSRRLAVDSGGDVWVYDTLDHQIGGFSQQQGMGSSIIFTSQYGTVSLSTLPVVSRNGQTVESTPPPAPSFTAPASPPPTSSAPNGNSVNETNIFDAIARLGELRDKGILTDDEFSTKKSELLGRL